LPFSRDFGNAKSCEPYSDAIGRGARIPRILPRQGEFAAKIRQAHDKGLRQKVAAQTRRVARQPLPECAAWF
jgi:hypothetical protein